MRGRDAGPGRRRSPRLAAVLIGLLLAAPTTLPARDAAPQPAPLGVPGITADQLDAGYWIKRLRNPDAVILSRDQIATQNVRMQDEDGSIHDIEHLPPTLEAERVRAWIEPLSVRPERDLYDETGDIGSKRQVDRIVANTALKSIPQTQVTRYGMVVQRADLRTFPTRLRVFNSPDDQDIDRFQESALFPGDPVAIVHESRDRAWYFVVSQRYAAWIEKQFVAQGDKRAIFEYGRRAPYKVVTGATASTVFTPENPAVSVVQLEMGVRVPLLADWPVDKPVNGQHPFAGHVIELPVRGKDGTLSFAPALLPRSADVADDYLPLTAANLLRQSFKFLGERYGWGHSYNTRDCSGFASEVYRSFGVLLPRNTRDQSVSPALNRLALSETDDHAARVEALRKARTGDLVYIPGHVMMVIGHVDGAPYAIHDTSGMSWLPEGASELERLHLNGVVVTPILPMMSNATTPTVDRITSIQRIRP